MKKLLVSVFDKKALSWSFPCQADNKASALRMFADLVNDKRSLIGQHPEDFDLYMVGQFDLVSGLLDGNSSVGISSENFFGNGLEFVQHEIRN